jgi:hypothetical protein
MERRTNKRYHELLYANAEYWIKGKHTCKSMNISNISSGGASILSNKPIEIGSTINLEIVDCETGTASELGGWNKLHGDMVNIRVQGEVLRNDNFKQSEPKGRVAIKFHSPIHIHCV